MRKGEMTRQAILDRATALASTVGLEGLTIGRLAEELGLSKSGLFAHFRSKENLEVEVIGHARELFIAQVLAPALKAPRGEPRVRALFERWLAWGARPGGCIFIALSVELDDQPGPTRDALLATQRDWLDSLATAARIAREEGHFRADLDPQLFAFELYGIGVASHTLGRLLKAPEISEHTRRAFEALLLRSR
jgi:AcrR family transcriptional regulator